MRYLHALQLMILIIRPAALAAAPQFSREELDELADRFTSSDSIYLADILESIMKHITIEPLHVILSETNHLLEWGHYFAYYPIKKHIPVSYTHLDVYKRQTMYLVIAIPNPAPSVLCILAPSARL